MTNATVDDAELSDILRRFVADLGSTAVAGNIVIGDRLGLYRALAEAGPLTAAELADYTGTSERYIREWLRGQAAGQLVSYGPDTDQYWMTAAQALAFADPNGLVLPGAFQTVLACFDDRSAIVEAFRSGAGFAWGEHGADVAVGCERFFRPGYLANLVSAWLPESGQRLAACGRRTGRAAALGAATLLPCSARPRGPPARRRTRVEELRPRGRQRPVHGRRAATATVSLRIVPDELVGSIGSVAGARAVTSGGSSRRSSSTAAGERAYPAQRTPNAAGGRRDKGSERRVGRDVEGDHGRVQRARPQRDHGVLLRRLFAGYAERA